MKKITTLVLALIFVSCGASKSASELPSKKTLKGTWEVYDIDFFRGARDLQGFFV